jgi:hypothetical protein
MLIYSMGVSVDGFIADTAVLQRLSRARLRSRTGNLFITSEVLYQLS